MFEDPSLVSYGFLSSTDMLQPSSTTNYKNKISIMNFTTFEEQFVKQKRLKEKKNSIRTRAEKSRNRINSDIESDTGSDGLAVNSSGSSFSGGSGRSGDWGPPKTKHKLKGNKKRGDRNSSSDDSGESTITTISSSCPSNFSKQPKRKHENNENAYRHLISNHVMKNGKCQQHLQNNPSMTRASSCSMLPVSSNFQSDIRLTKRPSVVTELIEDAEVDTMIHIEAKENAILEQCYKNEGLIDNKGKSPYVIDFAKQNNNTSQSKFPLPDHLNYPLCKYRSENVLNKPSPIKKIKNGLKKLKYKKQAAAMNNAMVTVSSESSIPTDDQQNNEEEEEDNATILARLSRNPKERKTIMQKILHKLNGASFSTMVSDDELPSIKRSISTKSIPEALKDMWSKVHDDQLKEEEPVYPGLTRAISMPAIPIYNSKKSDFERQKRSPNIFTNFFKLMEDDQQQARSKSKQSLVAGADVITGVLGMKSDDEFAVEHCLADADLSSVSDTIDSRGFEKEFFPTLSKGILKTNRKISTASTVSSEYSSTSQYSQRSLRTIPWRKSSLPIMSPHCPCCHNPQIYYAPHHLHQHPTHSYATSYPSHNYIYNDNYVPNTIVERVIAPLDIQVPNERRAARRKISEMMFDTFV